MAPAASPFFEAKAAAVAASAAVAMEAVAGLRSLREGVPERDR